MKVIHNKAIDLLTFGWNNVFTQLLAMFYD